MLTIPFLTDLDPQAAIKGSRDPLGIQPIWTRMGRHVVGNLTTVSTSVRDFTTTILGYYFAERVSDEDHGGSDLAVFLCWEQLAAYARGGINKDWVFRGTERAKKNFNETARLRLGTDSVALILSDQKTYGLWGLYSVPSRSSGLLTGDPARVTPSVRKFIEDEYLSTLSGKGRDASEIVSLLAKKNPELLPRDRDLPLFKAVGRTLRRELSPREQEFYLTHLVEGGPQDRTHGGQRLLVEALRTTFDVEDWSLNPMSIQHLAKRCRTRGSRGAEVAGFLEHIRIAEQLVAPAARLFMLLLGCDGQLPCDDTDRTESRSDVIEGRSSAMGRDPRRQVTREIPRREQCRVADPFRVAPFVDQLVLPRLPARGGDAGGGPPWLKSRQQPSCPTNSSPQPLAVDSSRPSF